VGDIFAWYVGECVPPEYHSQAEAEGVEVHELMSRLSAEQAVGEHGLVALDWHNGNRSVLVDHELSGIVVGQTLATTAPEVYRALFEATAFGTRMIIESFEASGVAVDELIVAGGLLKNPLLMQIYSDVTRRPLSLISSEQGSRPRLCPLSRDGGAVRRPVRGVPPAARLLRARRERRAAPPQGHQCQGSLGQDGPHRNTGIDEVRRAVCALHGELWRSGLVAWTSGNVSARVPCEELDRDQTERHGLQRPAHERGPVEQRLLPSLSPRASEHRRRRS
jgi:hypothetical protein